MSPYPSKPYRVSLQNTTNVVIWISVFTSQISNFQIYKLNKIPQLFYFISSISLQVTHMLSSTIVNIWRVTISIVLSSLSTRPIKFFSLTPFLFIYLLNVDDIFISLPTRVLVIVPAYFTILVAAFSCFLKMLTFVLACKLFENS